MLVHAHGRRPSLRVRLDLRLACMDMKIWVWDGAGRPIGEGGIENQLPRDPNGPLDEYRGRYGADRHHGCRASDVR